MNKTQRDKINDAVGSQLDSVAISLRKSSEYRADSLKILKIAEHAMQEHAI